MKPVPKLVPSVFPRTVVRASILGDLMTNYGIPDDVIHLAQTGLMAGDFTGMTFIGYMPSGRPQERSTLSFDKLTEDDNMAMKAIDGRSMVEALSRKLAHAVAASVGLMSRQHLRVSYIFHFPDHANANEICRKYGLTYFDDEDLPSARLLFRVTPGRDRGLTFSHYTSA